MGGAALVREVGVGWRGSQKDACEILRNIILRNLKYKRLFNVCADGATDIGEKSVTFKWKS